MTGILFYKLAGAALIILTAFEFVKSFRRTQSESLMLARDAYAFVRHTYENIFYKDLPVSGILESYIPMSDVLSEFYKKSALSSPRQIIKSSPPKYDEKTMDIMTDFYSELGSSYREAQLLLCERTEERLGSHIAELENEISSKNRILHAVTLFFAASVILILI